MNDYAKKMNEPQSQPEHIMAAIDMSRAIIDRYTVPEQLEMVARIKIEIAGYWQHSLEKAQIQQEELGVKISTLHENIKKL